MKTPVLVSALPFLACLLATSLPAAAEPLPKVAKCEIPALLPHLQPRIEAAIREAFALNGEAFDSSTLKIGAGRKLDFATFTEEGSFYGIPVDFRSPSGSPLRFYNHDKGSAELVYNDSGSMHEWKGPNIPLLVFHAEVKTETTTDSDGNQQHHRTCAVTSAMHFTLSYSEFHCEMHHGKNHCVWGRENREEYEPRPRFLNVTSKVDAPVSEKLFLKLPGEDRAPADGLQGILFPM